MVKAIFVSFLIILFGFFGVEKLYASDVTLPQSTLKEIKAIKQNFMSESKKLRMKIREKVNDVENLLASDANEMTLEGKFKEVQKLRAQHQRLRFNSVLQIRKLLKVDQRKYIKLFKEQTRPEGVERQNGCGGNSYDK